MNFSELIATTARKLPRRWLSKWNDIEIVHVNQFGHNPVEIDRSGEKKINIYKNILSTEGHKGPEELILIEFFKFVEFELADDIKRRFEYKFVLPPAQTIKEFTDRLRLGTYKSYKQIVEDTEGAVPRLTVIHLVNALLLNQYPISEARDLDVTTWNSTKDFASRKRYMSLTPLVSAYSPRELYESFPVAAAAYLENELSDVRESTTRGSFVDLMDAIVG